MTEGACRRRVDAVLARVARENRALGALSDVLEADARARADQIDAMVPADRSRLPLAGLPVVVKDLIDTPPAACCAGLDVFRDWRPLEPAVVVRRLREAGAVIIGVGATDHAGFGVRTAQVAHPLAPGHTVGGSSGGCAAAVAAGWVSAAIGTDTGGSVRIPAACCGVVGFKPSWGRVPTAGVRALVPSLDHVGPIATNVGEARALMTALDPGWPGGGRGERSQSGAPASWGGGGGGGGGGAWSDVRIGIARASIDASAPEVVRAVDRAIDRLCRLGVRLTTVELPGDPLLEAVHQTVFCHEAAQAWSAVLGERRLFDGLPALVRDTLLAGCAILPDTYQRAQQSRAQMRARVDRLFDSVDLLLLPTLPVLAPPVAARSVQVAAGEIGFTGALILLTRLFDHTGHPALALPLPASWSLRHTTARDLGQAVQAGPDRRGASLQLAAASGADAWLLDIGEALANELAEPAPR